MDGTFAYFPKRYGNLVSKDFRLQTAASFPVLRALPDSQKVTSYLDYTRGDFLLDELEIGLRSADSNSRKYFGMFKRDFAGREGQFLVPYAEIPIQQSYKMDYTSKSTGNSLDVSVIRLITDVGLPDDSSAETGRYTDEILSGGFLLKNDSDKYCWTLNGSQFNQKLMTNVLAYPDLGYLRLNRTSIHGRLTVKNTDFPVDHFGLNSQFQSIGDSSISSLGWNTVYAGLDGKGWVANAGFTVPADLKESQIYGEVNVISGWNGWNISANALLESSPRHYMERMARPGSQFETWYSGGLSAGKTWASFELTGKFFAGIREEDGFEEPYISMGPAWKWELYRRWIFSGEMIYSPNPIPESDGIGLRANIGIQGTEWLFRENMLTTFYLWADAAGMRSKSNAFHPVLHRPVSIGSETAAEDFGILNFRIDAVISSVLIRYQILNILNASYPTISGWFSDLDEESTFFHANPFLPKLGRRVSFSITWQFNN